MSTHKDIKRPGRPPLPGPTGSAAHYEPNGYKFRDAKNGEMMLVYEGEWKDWLAYRHPDGQWVSLRKATPADWHALGIAISDAHHAPNVAGQWRATSATRMQTDAQLARPLHQPGYAPPR